MASVLGHMHRLVTASRTDTGVHALEQYARFRSQGSITDLPLFLNDLNAKLPPTIRIFEVTDISNNLDFHPSLDATGKVYCYRILQSTGAEPRPQGYWHLYRPIDAAQLTAELRSLIGTHDFSSFCAGDSTSKSKVRTLFDVQVHVQDREILLWFAGNGFLKQMIRIVVGCAVERATGKKTALPLLDLLSRQARPTAARLAPADGLFLAQISYGQPLSFPFHFEHKPI